MNRIKTLAVSLLGTIILSACGGDGNSLVSGGRFDDADRVTLLTWEEDVYLSRNRYANFCAEPRQGRDEFDNNRPFPDRQGSVADENFFLRSWTNDLYLWYQEVPDLDPHLFDTESYFALLKTDQQTATNRPKDNFHFSQNTLEYKTQTEAGIVFGYGMDFVFGSTSPPRELKVRDVLPGSPAEAAGIRRGMRVLEIDGEDLINGNDVDTLNNGLFPSRVDEPHSFVMRPFNGGASQTFNLTSASLASVPVKNVTRFPSATGDVGYIHFNAHSFPSEKALIDAFAELAEAGVTDLILDLRYNGGGLLAIAAQAGFMIAGASETSGLTFYRTQFNDKYPNTDPVNGGAITPFPFIDEGLGFVEGDVVPGSPLPTLDLDRVFILASGGTCSASEAIINGLLGADIEVVLIGSTTCGKPYGFYPQDNCGTTYFSVQFAGVNEKGFGEYADGFSPSNQPDAPGVPVQGCFVEDDFSRSLGDPSEAMVAAALQYRENGSCPLVSVAEGTAPANIQRKANLGKPIRQPFQPGLNNSILIPNTPQD